MRNIKTQNKDLCHFISENPVKYNIIRIKKKNSLFFFQTKFCYTERSRFYHTHTLTRTIYFYSANAKTN